MRECVWVIPRGLRDSWCHSLPHIEGRHNYAHRIVGPTSLSKERLGDFRASPYITFALHACVATSPLKHAEPVNRSRLLSICPSPTPSTLDLLPRFPFSVFASAFFQSRVVVQLAIGSCPLTVLILPFTLTGLYCSTYLVVGRPSWGRTPISLRICLRHTWANNTRASFAGDTHTALRLGFPIPSHPDRTQCCRRAPLKFHKRAFDVFRDFWSYTEALDAVLSENTRPLSSSFIGRRAHPHDW